MDYRCRLVRKFIHCFGALQPRGKIGLSYSLGLWDFIFSCPLYFFPCSRISCLLFLCLISFLLFSCASVWENSCMSYSFPIVILNDTSFFMTVQPQVHNENPARYGRNTDALVKLNTKLNWSFFDYSSSFCFLIEFHCMFFISFTIIPFYVY